MVREISAAFETEYTIAFRWLARPDTELTLMIDPPPRSLMSGTQYLAVRRQEVTLMRITRSHSETGSSSTSPKQSWAAPSTLSGRPGVGGAVGGSAHHDAYSVDERVHAAQRGRRRGAELPHLALLTNIHHSGVDRRPQPPALRRRRLQLVRPDVAEGHPRPGRGKGDGDAAADAAAGARDEDHAPAVVLHRRGGGWDRPQLPADPLEALHRCGRVRRVPAGQPG